MTNRQKSTDRSDVETELNELLPQIKQFDIVAELGDKIRNFSAAIFAKRRMGKTHLAKYLLYQTRKWFKEIHLFSKTAYLQPGEYDFVPKSNIYNGFVPEKITEIWTRQEAYILSELTKGRKKEDLDIIMILFDDVITDGNIRHCPAFNDLFVCGRHTRIATIVLSQEFGGREGLPKCARANLDLMISFFPNGEYDRDLLVQQYLSTHPDPRKSSKLGHALLRSLCDEEYQAIIVANFKTTLDIPSYVFRLKAPAKIPKFVIGEKQIAFSRNQIQMINKEKMGGGLTTLTGGRLIDNVVYPQNVFNLNIVPKQKTGVRLGGLKF